MRTRTLATPALAAIALAVAPAAGDVVEDQNGLATDLFSGLAVVSSQSDAQVVTTGITGTLDSIDLQIWKSPGTFNDVTIRILSVTDGTPDPVSSGTLFTTTIPVEDLPTFDGIPEVDDLPLTNIDVSDGALEFEDGDQFAIAAFRAGPGAPPWVLWGRGTPAYPNGDGFTSGDTGDTWNVLSGPFTFRTFVDEAADDCPADLTGPGGDGVPDGTLTSDDFFFYLGLFADGDPQADLTGPGGDGVPDGTLTSDDFFFYLGLFAQGCP